MTDYHTLNIGKSKYNKIKKHVLEQTVFDNVKAFILHSVANQMMPKSSQDLGMQALQKLDRKNTVDSKKIRDALAEVATEKLEEK